MSPEEGLPAVINILEFHIVLAGVDTGGVGMLVGENENSHLLVTPDNQTFREAHRVSGRAFKAPWLYRLWSSSKYLHEADAIRNRMHFTQGH